MRYTRIDLSGRSGARAVLRRDSDAEYIDVEIDLPGISHLHSVRASDAADLDSMAECLHAQLDDHPRRRSRVWLYRHALAHLVQPDGGLS